MAAPQATLRTHILQTTAQNPFRCYQCGNCSAGCPVAGRSDLLPHQVMRLLQLGSDEVLHTVQPWLCVGCQTCAVRCPQELDLSKVMDALRAEARRRGTIPAPARRMAAFNEIFVDQVLAGGRLQEIFLGAMYNLRTLSPFQNLGALPGMLKRGKLRVSTHWVRDPGKVHRKGRPA